MGVGSLLSDSLRRNTLKQNSLLSSLKVGQFCSCNLPKVGQGSQWHSLAHGRNKRIWESKLWGNCSAGEAVHPSKNTPFHVKSCIKIFPPKAEFRIFHSTYRFGHRSESKWQSNPSSNRWHRTHALKKWTEETQESADCSSSQLQLSPDLSPYYGCNSNF